MIIFLVYIYIDGGVKIRLFFFFIWLNMKIFFFLVILNMKIIFFIIVDKKILIDVLLIGVVN